MATTLTGREWHLEGGAPSVALWEEAGSSTEGPGVGPGWGVGRGQAGFPPVGRTDPWGLPRGWSTEGQRRT